jgi:hypothetical protein
VRSNAAHSRRVFSFAMITGQCIFYLLAATRSTTAGSISITMELTATSRSGALAVSLKITNSGTEPAQPVMAGARFAGHEERGPVRPSLAPGEQMETAFDIPWNQPAPGQWPLTTTVDYSDRNGYAFQAMQVALVSAGATPPALVAVLKVDVGQVAGEGRVYVRLKSLSELARHARVQFFVPRGLEADPPARPLEIGPWADAEVSAKILSRGALPGSRYPVFVTVEYDDDSGHHATLGNGVVEIVAAQAAPVSYGWIVAALLMVAWAAVLTYRRYAGARLPGAASRDRP